jgi:hypothetical protein
MNVNRQKSGKLFRKHKNFNPSLPAGESFSSHAKPSFARRRPDFSPPDDCFMSIYFELLLTCLIFARFLNFSIYNE